jgi:DNA primase
LGRIPDELIQQIRDRVDLVDLVGRFVTLKKSGRNHKGLCPFHEEKTPSFNVNSDRGTFYCFGCQESGNAISFLMKRENLTFPEAVRSLGRECGIEIPERVSGEPGVAESLHDVNALAQTRYRVALAAEGSPGAAYLASRGIDADTVQRFGIGFAPDRWDTIAITLREKNVPAAVGERAGLLKPRTSGGHYDLLRGRVTFPIQDARGRVLGFGGRAIAKDQEPKYLNTPESPIFHKRSALFGYPMALEPIRRTDRAVVVEGYFDVIAMHRAGIEGVVATCGTALTHDHARDLRRRARHVVLLFDGDEAGQRAILRALEILLPERLRVRAVVLPEGDDPDTYLARHGAEALARLVQEAPPALEVVIRRAAAQGCRTPWEKADAVAAVAPLLALIPSAVERGEWCAQTALAVGTEARHVEAAVRAARTGEDLEAVVPAARPPLTVDRIVERLLRSVLEHPRMAARIPREEIPALLPGESLANLFVALVDAATDGRDIDVEALGEKLGDGTRALLHSLLADDEVVDEEAAERTVDDTLSHLRRQRYEERQQAITRRMAEPDADHESLLLEKQHLRDDFEHRNTPPMGTRH